MASSIPASSITYLIWSRRISVQHAHQLISARISKYWRSPELTSPYSHLFNKHGGWNKRGGNAKVAKSLNVEVGINAKGGIFWKKLVHKSNKRGVEGGKI